MKKQTKKKNNCTWTHIFQLKKSKIKKNTSWKKPEGEKHLTYRRIKIRITAYLFSEIIQARGEWNEIIKELRETTNQSRILNPAKLSFKGEGKIKVFSDKDWGNLLPETCLVKNMLKTILHREEKWNRSETWIYIKKRINKWK